MVKTVAKDLILDSHGNCFFCFHNKIPGVSLESMTKKYHPNLQLHSLEYLYRYLEMNKIETLNLELPNSTQLGVNRKAPARQRVKVYLCDDCATENTIFGKLYRQLEKIQMELISSLETIHMKLTAGHKAGEHSDAAIHELSMTNHYHLNKKLDLVQTVRMKAKEKCYTKLKHELPRIMLKKLSIRIPSPGRSLLPNTKSITVSNIRDPQTNISNLHTDESDSAEAAAEVKVEFVKVENYYSHGGNSDESENSNWLDDGTNSNSESDDIQPFKLPAGTGNIHDANTMKAEGGNKDNGSASYTIIKPAKVFKQGLIPDSERIINSATGSYKCRVCSMELKSSRNRRHYQRHHLSERYKCRCGKIFKQLSSYYLHYGLVHGGFECNVCKKGFGIKRNLVRHHQRSSCGKGIPPKPVKHSCYCRICGKGFARSRNLQRHHITSHLQLKRFECNLCKMKFKRMDVLNNHRRNIHQKRRIKNSQME